MIWKTALQKLSKITDQTLISRASDGVPFFSVLDKIYCVIKGSRCVKVPKLDCHYIEIFASMRKDIFTALFSIGQLNV